MRKDDRYTWLVVVGGRTGLLGFAFFGNLLIIRALGPHDFGIYALCVVVIKVFGEIVGESLDLAVVREVPVYLLTDRARALNLVRTVFWLRLGFGASVIGAAVIGASVLSEALFHTRGYESLIVIAAVGAVGDQLCRSASAYFQAAEDFTRFMVLEALLQVGRLGLVLGTLSLQLLTPSTALIVYVGTSYAVFGIASGLLPRDLRSGEPPTRQTLVEILNYSKWTMIALVIAATIERTDVLLLGYFRGPTDVGVYSAALTLAIMPDFVAGCVASVLRPRFVPAYLKGEFGRFYRDFLRRAVPVGAVAAVVCVFTGGFAVEAFFTDKYVAAIPVFKILVVGRLIGIVIAMLPANLLLMIAPRRTFAVNAVTLLLMIIGGGVVVAPFGILGAAVLVSTIRVANCVWVAWLSVSTVQRARFLRTHMPAQPGVSQTLRADVSSGEAGT